MILDDIKKSIEMLIDGNDLDSIVEEVGSNDQRIMAIRESKQAAKKSNTRKKSQKKLDGRIGGNRQKSHETFVEEVYEMYGDEYTVLGTYYKNKIPVKVRHNCEACNNHEWEPRPMDLLSGNPKKRNDCPVCRKARLKAERKANKNKSK